MSRPALTSMASVGSLTLAGCAGLLLTLASSPGAAAPVIIIDTTPGSAINDNALSPGEYAGFSTGINGGFGDVAGANSRIYLDSSLSGELHIGHQVGSASSNLNDRVVMYIDSVAGGIAGTGGLSDTGDALRRAISGFDNRDNSNVFRATLNFGADFRPDYAIAWDSGFGGLWSINPSGPHGFQTGVNLTNLGNNTNFREMSLSLANLGLSVGDSFKYVVTYLSDTAFRSNEFHGVAQSTVTGGNIERATLTLSPTDFNTFTSVPEPVSASLMALGFVVVLGSRIRVQPDDIDAL